MRFDPSRRHVSPGLRALSLALLLRQRCRLGRAGGDPGCTQRAPGGAL